MMSARRLHPSDSRRLLCKAGLGISQAMDSLHIDADMEKISRCKPLPALANSCSWPPALCPVTQEIDSGLENPTEVFAQGVQGVAGSKTSKGSLAAIHHPHWDQLAFQHGYKCPPICIQHVLLDAETR